MRRPPATSRSRTRAPSATWIRLRNSSSSPATASTSGPAASGHSGGSPPAARRLSSAIIGGKPPMIKPLILTVDDDPQVLRAIGRDLLTRHGRDFRVVRAQSGAEALEVLRHERENAQPVALLLTDQRMPNQDGVSFLAEARAIVPSAKRALLTAYADTDAAIAAINTSQVDYYLQKPWDPPHEHLYPIVDDLLDDWRDGYRPGWGGV